MTRPETRPGTRPVGLVRPRPLTDPRLRLVVLHHAGGSHLGYRRWARLLPAGWEACLVDAPGRGHLAHLPPLRSMPELVEHVLAVLEELSDRPVALFGHSMGALVGYAVTAELHARGLPLPVWLGVSAHPGPRVPGNRAPMDLHRLGYSDLRVALHHIGGLPTALLGDDATWAQVEPLIRADLEVAEGWLPPAGVRLPVPLTAFCGRADPVAGVGAVQRWGAHTGRFLGVRAIDGDHFYFRDEPVATVAGIVEGIGAVWPAVTSARAGGPAVPVSPAAASTGSGDPGPR